MYFKFYLIFIASSVFNNCRILVSWVDCIVWFLPAFTETCNTYCRSCFYFAISTASP